MAFDPTNPNPNQNPYDVLRKTATDSAQASGQAGIDAITRRYAAMGNLNSGSYTKALQEGARETQAGTEAAMGQIGGQEVGTQMQAKQLGQQESQFQQELPLQSRQLDIQSKQQELDSRANDLNYELAKYQTHHSGGFLGGGGFLGSGLGADK